MELIEKKTTKTIFLEDCECVALRRILTTYEGTDRSFADDLYEILE